MAIEDSEQETTRADQPSALLDAQKSAVGLSLKHFIGVARDVVERRRRAGSPTLPRHDARSHEVLNIDGSRGVGKTFVLLSIEHGIQVLSERWRRLEPSDQVAEQQREWDDFQANYTYHLIRLLIPNYADPTITHLAETLNIIFPDDMEVRESAMEAIFASMMTRLIDLEKVATEANKDKIQALRRRLREDVAQGWYFAKSMGHDAVAQEAMDYREFIEKFELETRRSARRIEVWRDFVDEYLNYLGAATLVIFLDDSDVKPDLAIDILHSLRMYLVHTRIVTVLAGNLRAMRSVLIHRAMPQLGQSMRALSNPGSDTADDWRRTERQAIEDYLEKVLPASQRLFISQTSVPRQPKLRHEDDDFVKISRRRIAKTTGRRVAGWTLAELSELMRKRSRDEFLATKYGLAMAKAIDRSDGPAESSRRVLENFLAWWVFQNRYLESLAPSTHYR